MTKKHWLTLLVIFLVIGLFYWFQIRPANIRSKCTLKSNEQATDNWKRKNPNRNESLLDPKAVEFYYQQCIQSKGLK